jgi:dipeptidyl aminopeptidase/acylaminoacyl peptidase
MAHRSIIRAAFAALITIDISFAHGTPAAGGKPLTPYDLIRVRTITETQISPDGSRVLYVLRSANLEKNRYDASLWIVPTSGGNARQLIDGAKMDWSPRWSPDGRNIAFLSDRDGMPQVWLIRAAGGEASELTGARGGVGAFEWGPDGRSIAFLSESYPAIDESFVRLVDRQSAAEQLRLVDVASREERLLTDSGVVVSDFSWAPDGRHIAVSILPASQPADDFHTDLYVVNVKDETMSPLVVRDGRDDTPRWSPDGTRIAFLSSEGETGEFATLHLCIVPATGGEPHALANSLGERIYDFYGWSSGATELYFRSRQGVAMHLFAASVETGATRAITRRNIAHDAFSFSREPRQKTAFVASDPCTPKDLFVSQIAPFEARRLVESNTGFGAFRCGESKIVHWKSRDGMTIEGLLTLPIGYVSNRPVPLLVAIHGGPSGAFSAAFAPQFATGPTPLSMEVYPPQLFAERGYAMFMPNIRGSGGYGEHFRKLIMRDWGGADLDDVLDGVDDLVRQGVADPERLGILGWSYGGFMTASAITKTHRFKAAQIGAGASDLISLYGTSNQPDQIAGYLGGPPWSNYELYRDRSPVYHAVDIVTPTLIQQGELDTAIPKGQAEELYRALQVRGVPVEFAVYPRSGHSPTEPRQNLDVWTRSIAWFDSWLAVNGR